ncbi:MAG: hypothetical protein A4E60_03174 [Syntrophorhabdus sp. PtaB.Bin047]|jgi:hypothetical protein|nr:MAG: hypothetical protein A4E60_03174 [Syntrophorhabdus sp. PtaB.Bin047]
MNDSSSKKLLIGAKAISAYLTISKNTFYKFVREGLSLPDGRRIRLPATVIDKVWYAHTDNLDEFFKVITLSPVQEIPDEKEEDEAIKSFLGPAATQ